MLISYSTTFVDEANAEAVDFDGNFDTVKNVVNGNLEDENIKTGAAINPTKILGTALTTTDATEANTASKIVKRDSNKNINISKITGTDVNFDLSPSGDDAELIICNDKGLIVKSDDGYFFYPDYDGYAAKYMSLTYTVGGGLLLLGYGGYTQLKSVDGTLFLGGNNTTGFKLTDEEVKAEIPIELYQVATASIPAAAAGNKGYILYDSTLNKLKFSTGSAWETITSA